MDAIRIPLNNGYVYHAATDVVFMSQQEIAPLLRIMANNVLLIAVN